MTTKIEQIAKPWSEQRTAEDYLRKIMVEHFGWPPANPEEIDSLWKEGYWPPVCIGEQPNNRFHNGYPSGVYTPANW